MRRDVRHGRRPWGGAGFRRAAVLLGAAFVLALLAAACGSGAGDAIRSSLTNLPGVSVPTPSRTLPTTEAPTTEAPTTEAPTTEAPTTEAPTTEAPTTEPPTTEAPTTEPPTTEAPTTEAPTTEAPTTEAPTESASPVPTETTGTTEESNGLGWIWLIVFAVLLVLLLLLAFRREPKGPTWQEQVLTIYSLSATYRDALTMEIVAPSAQAAPESAARWNELDQQANELAARLHGLEASPKNEAAAAAVAQALAELTAVRSAARTYQAGRQTADAETLRSRLNSFEQAVATLRTV
jgi:hypothetical protein